MMTTRRARNLGVGRWGLERRLAAVLSLGALVACGGPSGDTGLVTSTSNDDSSAPVLTANGTGAETSVPGTVPVAAAPASPSPDAGAVAPAQDAEAPAAAPAPVVAPPAGSTFSWTAPDGFYASLETAIGQQSSYMGGYGGQIANPFPQLDGTARFSGLQITRADAVILANHFGRPSFRFYVDAQSLHSNGLRAEFTGAADYRFQPGDTYNYRFSTYFTADYRNSSWTEWNMFAQFHGPGFPAWGLHTAGGYLHMKPPEAAANEYRIPMPARDRWHDFDWTVHWAPDASGYATLLVDGVRVFEYRGATMHAGEAYYYPKFGSYLANNPYTQVTYTTPWIVTRL